MHDRPDEQRRYDGAPAPPRNAGVTAGDMKAAAVDAKQSAVCDHCGADEEYDRLTQRPDKWVHNCPRTQAPDPDPVLLCGVCLEAHTPKGDYLERFRETDAVHAFYACGVVRDATEPEPEMIEYGEEMIKAPHQNLTPHIPVRCECGAGIEEVLY